MRLTEPGDRDGMRSIALLAEDVVGPGASARFVGAVRNIVESAEHDYDWPTPLAHFGVWESNAAPVVEGTWVSLADEAAPLGDRHWYALALDPRLG